MAEPAPIAAVDEDQRPALSRRPLGSQIADRLREDILLGRLAGGTALSQQSLCEMYGTSRMPVRDALRQLAAEGLIVSSRSGHSEVAGLSAQEIHDAFYVEACVHGRLAKRAAEAATNDDLMALRALHEDMVRSENQGDLRRVADTNWKFHRAINLLAGSPKLLATVRTVSLGIPREYLIEMPEWASRANREHAEILAAFEGRAFPVVEALVASHVETAGANLVDFLVRRWRDATPGSTRDRFAL